MQKSIGVSKRIRPPIIVTLQFSTFTPVGIAISMLDATKEQIDRVPKPDGKHVMRPNPEAQEGDGDRRAGDEFVAEDRFA